MTWTRRMSTTQSQLLASISFCLVLCVLVAGCAESSQTPEVLVERGHLMESRGQFQEAIDAYAKALAQRPTSAATYYDRGVAYGRLNSWKEAAGDYSRAIEHDPGMARAYNNRATAYAELREYQKAIADFTQAIALDPRGALTYRNRGLAYHDLGQVNQAIEDYTVAIRLDPSVFEGLFERGNAYLDTGDYKKAVADFDRAIAIDPTHATAWLNRGEAYRRLGDSKRADEDSAKARQLEPGIVAAATSSSPPKQLTVTAESKVSRPDSAARRERALQVAKDFLKSNGFQIESLSAPAPFDLLCSKGSVHFHIEIQVPAEGQTALRFTREQIEAACRTDQPTALLVVGKLAAPAASDQPYTAGAVVEFVENWKPVQQKLVPVVFEYPLH